MKRFTDRLTRWILARKTLKETVWAYLGKMLAVGFGLGYITILSRGLGPARYGMYSLCTVIAQAGAMLCSFGVSAAVATVIARLGKERRGAASRALTDGARLRLVLTVAGTAAVIGGWGPVIRLIRRPDLLEYRWVAGLLCAGISLSSFWRFALEGLHRQKHAAVAVAVEHATKLAMVAVVAGIGLTVGGGLSAMSVGWMAGTLAGLLILRQHHFDPAARPQVEGSYTREILARGFPLALFAMGTLALQSLGSLLLGRYSSDLQVGYYGLATDLTRYLIVAAAPLTIGVAPRFAASQDTGRRELARLHTRLSLGILVGFGALVIVLGVLTPWGLELLMTGKKLPAGGYGPAVPVIRLMLIQVCLFAVNRLNLGILRYLGRTGLLGWIQLAVVVTHVVLSSLLVGTYGAVGVALSLVVSQGLSLLLVWIAVRRLLAAEAAAPKVTTPRPRR
jgi:O-antigen/teichoic acid export membrane protein